MTDPERSNLLLEMHTNIAEVRTDVKWLKEQHEEHMASHARYIYYLITCVVACIASWFR